MKARLIKAADVAQPVETERRKKAFKPKRGLSEEDRLRRILARWMEVVDNPQLYAEEDYLYACNEALECVKSIKRIWRKEGKEERKQSHIHFGILFAEEVQSVRPKKDCKLPKSTGHGLRVAQKDNDPKRGRGPTPGAKPTIVTAWSELQGKQYGPTKPGPMKHSNAYNGAIGRGKEFRAWQSKPPSRKNGNGNGRK